MRLPRLLLRPLLLCTILLAVTTSLASAAHVAGVLPLSGSPNHPYEKFTPTLFPSGDYSNYDFSFADLSNCTFAGPTNLTGANFRGANLTNVNFSGCTLNLADFRGANLTNASLPCVGGADFRGAILTGTVGGGDGCFNCMTYGSSLIDFNCTVLPSITMCLIPSPFRGLVAGVVFSDLNLNGTLDLGEPGVPGAAVNIPALPISTGTDSRGGYLAIATVQAPGTVTVTLPVGWTHSGPALQNYNLGSCRSAQQLNFPATSQVVPAQRSTFSRVKAIYR